MQHNQINQPRLSSLKLLRCNYDNFEEKKKSCFSLPQYSSTVCFKIYRLCLSLPPAPQFDPFCPATAVCRKSLSTVSIGKTTTMQPLVCRAGAHTIELLPSECGHLGGQRGRPAGCTHRDTIICGHGIPVSQRRCCCPALREAASDCGGTAVRTN